MSRKGFTLLEVLTVVAIMGLAVVIMAPRSGKKVREKRVEWTLQSMEELKKAIVGTVNERLSVDTKFAGYVQDMGELPDLIDENGGKVTEGGQPKGLWTRDIDGDGTDDIPKRYMHMPCRENTSTIFLGWRGPYIKAPLNGLFEDGWGNPLIFEREKDNFIIKSLGADGKEGGRDYERDILFTIRENEWMASVAGYICPYVINPSLDPVVHPVWAYIYYGPKDAERTQEHMVSFPVDNDGYFHFDKIPIGTNRLLKIVQEAGGLQCYKIYVEPGMNWLGNMGRCP